jgi:pyruvate dehydrogenase E2 component (dihydrolipoamide acetyltransferase)
MRDINVDRPVSRRLVPAALLLKASALAARAVPGLNGLWVDDHLVADDHVHLGVAVSLRPSGLVAPAILDADTLDLDVLMEQLRDVVTRARSGRLRRTEMTDGTLTITNLGDNGAESVFGVIFPPQVALVGLGRIVERPWASDGMLGVRPTLTATLSGDHRATDGHTGSRYLAALDDLLQAPEKL